MSETARLGLPLLAAAQAQKHITHNEALAVLDMVVQASVLDRDLTVPPGTPAEGDAYIVAAGASGDWSGHDGEIAAFSAGVWMFAVPFTGLLAWLEDEAVQLVWQSGQWRLVSELANLQNVPQIGVNTTADATNRFAVKSNAVLFAALEAGAGGDGDVRFTVNKETAGDTGSLLFQTGWSGRAEVGLTGGEDLSFKVSPDGSAWHTGLQILPANNGRVAVTGSGLYVGDPSFFRNATSDNRPAIEIGAPDGSLVLNVQDGDGRFNMRWNASSGIAPAILKGGDRAWELDMDSGFSGFGLSVRESNAEPTAENDPVVWDTIFAVGRNGIQHMGSNVLTEAGNGGAAGRLGGQVVTVAYERSGGTVVGNRFALGNGATLNDGFAVPFDAKLLAATIVLSGGSAGVLTVNAWHNGAENSSYQLSADYQGAAVTSVQDYQSSPLQLLAGDTLNWRVAATAGGDMQAIVTAFVVFD